MSSSDWRSYSYDAIGNLRSKAGVTYGYPQSGVDSIHPHAVISTTAGGSFSYDENGNMTERIESGSAYTQTWDYENRLTSVTNQATGETTTFTYDANGDLVKASDGCLTTYYHGDLYEEQVDETTPVTVPDAGFEYVDDWNLVGYPQWPATSFYTDTLGTGTGHSGDRGLAISNHASGNIYSDPINATAGITYELKAWIRGELDPDDSAGCWTLRLFYFGQSGYLGEGIAAGGCGGLAETEWQEVGAESALTTPPGTSQVKVAFYAFMNSGWLAVDDLSLKVEGQIANLLPNPGFESAATWTFVADPRFPGTSVWRNTWGTSEGRGGPGTYAVAISNHAYGLLKSARRAVTPGQQYDLHAWVRGELDADDSHRQWRLRAQYYDASDHALSYDDVAVGYPYQTSPEWAQYGGSFVVDAGAVYMRVQLINYLNSGWVAFDDVELKYSTGGENLLANPGFEDTPGSEWTEVVASAFPGTSFYRGTWGTAAPHTGNYAWSIGNHAFGHAQSAEVSVAANQCYLLGAWLHGEVDEEDAFHGWIVRLEFYDGQQYLGYQDAVTGRWVNPAWSYVEGRVQTPAGTSKARVKLLGQMTGGWVTFDDVSLRACASGGQGAPGGGGISGSSAPGAEQPVEPSPEDLLLLAEPDWELVTGAPCLDGDDCPPVEGDEVPTPVRWALPEAWEAVIPGKAPGFHFGELLGQAADEPSEPQAGIESAGTTVVKRYVFGGRVVAMRRGEALYFLSGDHLGSASVTLDGQGRWLADHRFWPYGETKRLDGASESYPTDRLFTGMSYNSYIKLYTMGARQYDIELGRWLSPDAIIPDPANPQSLNRYSYVYNRPLRYRDPTGFFEEEWEEQFEQEHGRPPTEQDWWDYQFSLQIQDWIGILWEQTYRLRMLLWHADVTLMADGVKWTVTQAELVGEAVKCIGETFGGDVRRFIGGVTIRLQPEIMPWWLKMGNAFRREENRINPAGYEYWGMILLEPDSSLGTLLHEMGHYFDEKKGHRLGDYRKHLRQSGLPTQYASEDFAQAFRFYALRVQQDPAKVDYLDQFRIGAYPHAGGYVWLER